MKLTVRELRILSRLICYDDKFELTKEEMDDDEFDNYVSDWDNLKVRVENWFFNYLDEKIYTFKSNDKELYFFRNDSENIDNGEVEELLDKVNDKYNINSIEEFNDARDRIFEENNYDPEYDLFDEYDDDYKDFNDEEKIENLLGELKPVKFEIGIRNYYITWDAFREKLSYEYNSSYEIPGVVYFRDEEKLKKIIRKINKDKITKEQFIEAYKKVFADCL